MFPNRQRAERQPLQCDERAKIKISHSWLATLLESSTNSCLHEQNAWKCTWNTDVTRTYVRGWRLSFHATNVQRSCGTKKGLTDCTAIQCSPLAGTMEVKLTCAEGRPLQFAVGIRGGQHLRPTRPEKIRPKAPIGRIISGFWNQRTYHF